MSQQILPLAVWQSGTNENSIPANDNSLRVEVALKEAISIADSEPADPEERDLHVVGTSWGGFTTNNAVIYLGGTWYEFEAFKGWFKSIAGDLYSFDGTSWNLVTGGGGGGTAYPTINEQTGAAYTLALEDAGALVTMNNASANTLTVPPDSAVAFPVGTRVDIGQDGSGQTTVEAGSGVTIRTPETRKLRRQWAKATLIKRAADVWDIEGNLEASP